MKSVITATVGLAILSHAIHGCKNQSSDPKPRPSKKLEKTPSEQIEALVGKTFWALGSGDSEASLSTWPTEDAFNSAWNCPGTDTELQSRFNGNRENAVNEPKKFEELGLRVSDWSLIPTPIETRIIKIGESHQGCTAKVNIDVRQHRVEMTLTGENGKTPPEMREELEKTKSISQTWSFARLGEGSDWLWFEVR